jgi:hypothetical protein
LAHHDPHLFGAMQPFRLQPQSHPLQSGGLTHEPVVALHISPLVVQFVHAQPQHVSEVFAVAHEPPQQLCPVAQPTQAPPVAPHAADDAPVVHVPALQQPPLHRWVASHPVGLQ